MFAGINDLPNGLTVSQLGNVFLALISVFSFIILYKGKGRKSAWFLCAGVLFALTFLLSVKMHERYLYPSLAFILAAYVYTKDKRLMMFYAAYSAFFFVNCADVLNLIHNGNALSVIERSMPYLSLLCIILTAALAVCAWRVYARGNGRDLPDLPAITDTAPVYPAPSGAPLKLGWRDWAIMALLTAVYAAAAFYNLGDKTAPQTAWHANAGQYAVFEMDSDKPVKTIALYLGPRVSTGDRVKKRYAISVSNDGHTWDTIKTVNCGSENHYAVFKWMYEDMPFTARFARAESLDNDFFIMEMAFLDADGSVLPVHIYSASPPGDDYIRGDPLISQDPRFLIDEQQLVPETYSFMNSAYFDEIYHARTAYEYIHRLQVYEWTHPPLGKDIISWGIMLFGMAPFGWRFAGAVFGALMLPALYIFAKKMFRGSDWAFFAAILLTCDFMHFVQTRIATIDVFVTFFIIPMYFFMYLYYSLNFFEKKPGRHVHSAFARSLAFLLCCGVFAGLAAASKWEGLYAMAGLPVLFFYTMYRRRLEYRSARAEGRLNAENWNLRYFPAYAAITLCGCLVFFIIVPAAIYALSYIPYMNTPNHPGILKNQIDMFRYHTGLVSSHSFASYWFQWPVMLRPIYYYAATVYQYAGDAKISLSEGITALGNPAVWWAGIAAALYGIRAVSKKSDKTALFLLIAYASQYLPWIFVTRTTYIYHYFPSVPFVILLIAYMFKDYFAPRGPLAAVLYILLTALLFIAFYPALSAFPAPQWYVALLRWMPTWSLS